MKKTGVGVALAVGLGVIAGGCGTTFAVVTDTALELRRDHYRVLARPDGSLAEGEWLVDNFQVVNGRPRELKRSYDRMRYFAIDWDDDGRADAHPLEPIQDLELVHARDGATMWTQTTPLGGRLARRDLDVIAHDFVDRVGGGSYVTIDWGADALRERHVGTVIREEGPIVVDGVPGYWVTFEIVSVDQREVNQAHQGDWVTVVLVRPEALWTESGDYGRTGRGVPMLVTVGLASRAEHHATHRAEFEELLRRIDFHETE